VELRCTGLALGGRGVCRTDADPSGIVVFVPGCLAGERLSARVTRLHDRFAEAALLSVHAPPAEERVAPACALAGVCGGCSLQHLRYDAQLSAKGEHVREALQRLGGFAQPPVLPARAAAAPLRYRNKTEFSVLPGPKGGPPLVGLLRAASSELVDVPACPLQSEEADSVLSSLRAWLARHAAAGGDGAALLRRVMLRTASAPGGGPRLVQVDLMPPPEEGEQPLLAALAAHLREQHPNLVSAVSTRSQPAPAPGRGGRRAPPPPPPRDATRTLAGEAALPMRLGGLEFRVSSRSFFQVNERTAETLLAVVIAAAALPRTGAPRILDLFCGTGALSLPLLASSPSATLLGVDVSEAAVADARAAARAAGLGGRASFRAANLASLAPMAAAEGEAEWDCVLVDPARAGLAKPLVAFLRTCRARRLVYTSCDGESTQLRELCARVLTPLQRQRRRGTCARCACSRGGGGWSRCSRWTCSRRRATSKRWPRSCARVRRSDSRGFPAKLNKRECVHSIVSRSSPTLRAMASLTTSRCPPAAASARRRPA